MLLLKSVTLFTDTPYEVLAELAALSDECDIAAGQDICRTGDPGDCMYVIADGRVRVHDGERTLTFLGKRETFGEMAMLDPEPRSASVTAVEPTRLLLVRREPFFQLVAERSEVARGIIHILAQRLRARTRDMVEDYQYMQHFARVTAAGVAVEAGVYEPEALDEVAARGDELGRLARVLQRMAREVYAREIRFKQQVQELRIEIDTARRARQVTEITETDYFKQLQQRAQSLRTQRGKPRV